MTRFNFNAWFAENKPTAILGAVVLSATIIMGCMTWSAWEGYITSVQEQESIISKLTALAKPDKPFPNDENLKKLTEALAGYQSDLKKLQTNLQKYQVPVFGDLENAKPQDRSQLFQDELRSEVTKIKALSKDSASTLPTNFYLGLGEYENSVPKSDDTILLAKRLTVLDWIMETLVKQGGVQVDNFSRLETESVPKTDTSTANTGTQGTKKIAPSQNKIKTSAQHPQNVTSSTSPTTLPESPYTTVGNLQLTFRSSQESFRNFLNAMSVAPYFLVIENLQIQNTSKDAPKRSDPQQQAPKSASGKPLVASRLHFVVGGPEELLNIAMKIRILEFPKTTVSKNDPTSGTGTSAKTTSPSQKDKATAK